jgi:hypothetical protein
MSDEIIYPAKIESGIVLDREYLRNLSRLSCLTLSILFLWKSIGQSSSFSKASQYLRRLEKRNPNTFESRLSRLALSSAASSFILRL